MTTRNKVVKKELVNTKVCDICLTDIKPTAPRYVCYACKKDVCDTCLENKGFIKLCRNCAGDCKGCNDYPVESLVANGLKFCPNCGYQVIE